MSCFCERAKGVLFVHATEVSLRPMARVLFPHALGAADVFYNWHKLTRLVFLANVVNVRLLRRGHSALNFYAVSGDVI